MPAPAHNARVIPAHAGIHLGHPTRVGKTDYWLLCQLCHCASVWRVLSGERVDVHHRFLLISSVTWETGLSYNAGGYYDTIALSRRVL